MNEDANHVSPRVMELVSDLTDGQLPPSGRLELSRLLSADRASLEWYLQWIALHTMLHLDLAGEVPLPTPRLARVHRPRQGMATDVAAWIDPDHIISLLDEEEAAAERRIREAEEAARLEAEAASRRQELQFDRSTLRVKPAPSPHGWYVAVAIAASLLFAVSWQLLSAPRLVHDAPQHSKDATASRPVGPQYVGAVVRSYQARGEKSAGLIQGGPLTAGRFALEAGVVEVALATGARIIVEAPAALDIISADRVHLEYGRIVANVPPEAVGFTLRARAASFVDLGTEFGVEVTREGAARIHVLQGEVALVQGDRQPGQPSRTLQIGAANQISADGSSVRKIAFDASQFLRRVPTSPYDFAVLKSRPLAYWRLDKRNAPVVSEGRLALSAFITPGVDLVDASENAKLRGGPGGAAKFEGEHDGILVTVDQALGIVSECTYEAWVVPQDGVAGPQRIFSTFDRPRSGMAIGVVDGNWYRQSEDGLKFHLTVYGDYDCVSATPIVAGEWVHLAATIDDAGSPALYVNGELVERLFRPIGLLGGPQATGNAAVVWHDNAPTPIGRPTAGEGRIGRNPHGSDGQISPERWEGLISHVAVYGRALSGQEIEQHVAAIRDTAGTK